ncbi:MAG TPA: VCBS repeat-containing protein, partial [Candidatus Acidoferrum sp.]
MPSLFVSNPRMSSGWRMLILGTSFYLLSVLPVLGQSFSAPTLFTVGVNTAPTPVAVGDFNGDGIPDLLVSNRGTNNVSVLLGNGDGTFQAPINTAVGTLPSAVVVGDFNGDGKLDLAVANSGDGTVTVLFGNGDGTFTINATYTVGNTPIAIAFGQCGSPCLAVVNQSDQTVSVLLGKTSGSFFVESTTLATGNTPVSIVMNDVNGDGNVDIIVANNGDSTVSVFLGDGHGDFPSSSTSSTGVTATTFPVGSLAVGDFNGDGKPDVAVVNGQKVSGVVTVLLGNGDGTFSLSASYGISGSLPTPVSVAIADFNLDGKLDIVVSNLSSDTVSLLLGNGDGTFQTPVNFSTGGVGSVSVAAADLNGDGRPDLAVANQNSGNISVLLNLNTPLGLSVHLQLLDRTTKTSPVSLTFSDVTQAGLTTLNTSSAGPTPPTGFLLGNPPTYYNLNTTALFSGPISICVNYSTIAFLNPAALHLFHFDNGAWDDVTSSLDTGDFTICGSVNSLSPFMIGEEEYTAQIQQPINADGSSVFNGKRGVVPVKFTLAAEGVPICTLPPANIVV